MGAVDESAAHLLWRKLMLHQSSERPTTLTLSMSAISSTENNRWLIKTCVNNTYSGIGNISNTSYLLWGWGLDLFLCLNSNTRLQISRLSLLTALLREYCCLATFRTLDNEKAFGIPLSCFHWWDFTLQHKELPLRRQNLSKNCVSMCHNHQSQLMGLPVAQKHLQEIEHQTCNLPLLWTPGVRSTPECLSGAQNEMPAPQEEQIQKEAQLFLQPPSMKPYPFFRLRLRVISDK